MRSQIPDDMVHLASASATLRLLVLRLLQLQLILCTFVANQRMLPQSLCYSVHLGEEDDQLVVTALKQMSGTCRLLDLPSLEGQELDVVRQFLRSNPDVIEAAYERLRQP